MSEQASPTIEKYFESIEKTVDQEYKIAGAARLLGHDPEKRVDSPLARNMVERVEGLISAVAPQLIGSGVTERMFELEKQYGVLDWRVSLVIAHEVGEQKLTLFLSRLNRSLKFLLNSSSVTFLVSLTSFIGFNVELLVNFSFLLNHGFVGFDIF